MKSGEVLMASSESCLSGKMPKYPTFSTITHSSEMGLPKLWTVNKEALFLVPSNISRVHIMTTSLILKAL